VIVLKNQPEEDPVYKFIHLDGLARRHETLLVKGQKLELPAKPGEKIIIDQYEHKDGVVHMEVMEKNRGKISRTSFKLERKYVGVDARCMTGFKEMLTINHTLLEDKSNRVTSHNTRLDFTKGKIIEEDISEIADTEKSEYLRDYFSDLERKEKNKKSDTSFFSKLFKKEEPCKEEEKYKENFEKILHMANRYKSRLDSGQHIEFNLSPQTTVVINKYKPDVHSTELNILEKSSGKISKIDYKMEKKFTGAPSGFSDSCYSKALLTVNHTLLNTRDKSVKLKEAQIDCLGGHIKEVDTKEIKKSENRELYEKHADYVRGYMAEITSYDKEPPLLKKLLSLKDKSRVDEHVKNFEEIHAMLNREKIQEKSLERRVINLSPDKKLIIDAEYPGMIPKSFHIIEKHKKGFKKTEYELERRFTGGDILGDTSFMQLLSVNTTLLDTKDKILSFVDTKIDLEQKLLVESHKEIIKKSDDTYEHYAADLLDESKLFEHVEPVKKQSFLSFLDRFKKGRL